MDKNNTVRKLKSSKKLDPGFAQIRRGLRDHLYSMSSNAVKLYLWLHLAAWWSGPKRGTVEASCSTIMEELDWTDSMLGRTLKELKENGYVELVPAKNQYTRNVFRILKYDGGATFTSERSKSSAASVGAFTSERSVERSKRNISSDTKEIHTPNKAIRKQEKAGDGGRPQSDAGRRLAYPPIKPSKKKRKNLEERLGEKVSQDAWIARDCLKEFGFDEWEEVTRALRAVEYPLDPDDPLLTMEFIDVTREVYEENKEKDIPRGILATKMIDRCREMIKRGEPTYWPPSFEKHRNQLREKEREQETCEVQQ